METLVKPYSEKIARKRTWRVFMYLLAIILFSLNTAYAQFGIINTIAGTGTAGFLGDGGIATLARLDRPLGVWVTPAGDIYFADQTNNRVRKITVATGIITTVAGNGTPGSIGDGGSALTAELNAPAGICIDATGNLFIADFGNNKVREVTAGGIISTVAGNGTAGFFGDGGLATAAEMNGPYGVWVEPSGNILITDENNYRVRKVTAATGIMSTIAGTGTSGFCCDGSPATAASFSTPSGIVENASGTIFFSTENADARVRKIDPSGIIHTEEGTGTGGFSGDCGPATAAQILHPRGLAIDAAGNLYMASYGDQRIREVDAATNLIHTDAGNGGAYSGDGGPALSAGMLPEFVFVDLAGNIYITGDNRVREVTVGLHRDTLTICNGSSVTLGSATTYADSIKWSTGATTSSITVDTAGVYTVALYVCAFISRDTFVVKSCLTPLNNGPLCPHDTLKLQAVGDSLGANYLWYGPGGFTSTVQNPVFPNITQADSGDYYVVKSYDGIVDTAFTDVTVKYQPVVTVGSNSPVCSGVGDTLFLTATPDSLGETFAWSGPNGFSSTLQDPSIVAPPITDQGIYKVVTALNGCTDSNTAFVIIDSTPVQPNIGSNAPICSQRDTLNFVSADATAGVTYLWHGPLGFITALQNPTILPDVHVPASGVYTVTATLVTDGVACSSKNTTNVVVDSTPYLPILGSNSPLCSGNSLLLTATSTSGANYSWTGPNGFTSLSQNPTVVAAATIASGTYSAFAAIVYPGIPAGCISDTAHITVVVDSTPQIPVATSNSPGPPGNTACEGDTLQLMATDGTAGVIYNWAGPYSFASTDQDPVILHVGTSATGTFTVTATLGGCSSSAVTSVAITPTPPLTATNNGPVCSGVADTILLQATSGPGATYSWAGPYTFSSLNQNPFRTPVIYEYGGVYQVTAFLNGCASATVNDTVIVRQTPEPPGVAWLTYCQAYPASPLQAMGDSILWYATSGSPATGTLTAPVPSTVSPGISWFYASQTIMGCTSFEDSIKVTVNPTPTITVSSDSSTSLCPGDSVILTASSEDPVTGYYWSPGQYLNTTSGPVVVATPETNIVYTVVGSNVFGCSDTAAISVQVQAAAVLNIPDSVTLYPGDSYQLEPLTNCSTFSWFPPIGLSDAHIADPLATPGISTLYIVHASTTWGCTTVDSINIYINSDAILTLPNAFTPGNGSNSEFTLIQRGVAGLEYFRIFDRWGIKVFETTDINQGWDGNYKGKPQPFGVYVYEVSATTHMGNSIKKHGNVTLLR